MNYQQDTSGGWREGDVILNLYEVKQVFTQGGMGLVYRVRHRNWNLDLAVKRPRPRYFHKQQDKEAFTREAEAWVNLGLHPHVTSCYYVRNLDGVPTVFAEFVEGGSLHEWIHSRKLYEGGPQRALERILDVAIQFAWGLHYAHERGLVHQDVKPSNVMMTPTGVAKVTDFGLAQARALTGETSQGLSPGRSMVVPGAGLMTVAYASPEQREGRLLTRKTDIWSWGASVLEMFAGGLFWLEGPFVEESLDDYLMSWRAADGLPEMPGEVVRLLRHCFKPDADERPPNMLGVSSALQELCRRHTGRDYPRREPRPAKAMADSLNNRAVSMLDLGRQDEAEKLWDEALRVRPHHQEATYNRGLFLWRAGRIADDQLVRELEEVKKAHAGDWTSDYLLGLVHLERDDADAALEALGGIEGVEGAPDEVRRASAVARGLLPQSNRLVRTFEGHAGRVTSVATDADWRFALTGSDDKTLKLWEVATGRCLGTFTSHEHGVKSVSLSPGGRYALSESSDEELKATTLKVWDVATGLCLRTFENHPAWGLSIFSPHGPHILSRCRTKHGDVLVLWHMLTGSPVRLFDVDTDWMWLLSLSPDGSHALTGCLDNTVKLWEVATGRCLQVFRGHANAVYGGCMSHNGRYVLSCGVDGATGLWDARTGRLLWGFAAPPWGVPASATFTRDDRHVLFGSCAGISPDGQYALAEADAWEVRLLEVRTSRCLRTFTNRPGDPGSADWGGASGSLKLWRIGVTPRPAPSALSRIVPSDAAGRAEAEYEASLRLARAATQEEDFPAAARHLREARAQPGFERDVEALKMWGDLYGRLPRKGLKGVWEQATFGDKRHVLTTSAVNHDGTLVLSGCGDGTLLLWDVQTRQLLRTFRGHSEVVGEVCFSPDGRHVLSASHDKTMRLWEVETGRCVRTFAEHTKLVGAVCFSPDGRWALSTDDKALRLWEVKTGRLLRTFEGHTTFVDAAGMTPDGNYAVSGSRDATLKLWELKTGRCARTFRGHTDAVTSLGVSPDGRYVLSGGEDNTLRLWELETGDCVRTFESLCHRVWGVSLSHDGRFALSGSFEGTLELWDVESGRRLRDLRAHSSLAMHTCFSPDGRYAISNGGRPGSEQKIWLLDWDLEERGPADWDEGARPYLRVFLNQQTPYAADLPEDHQPTEEEITLALTRRGRPEWSEGDFQRLLYTLGCAGYGWLNSEGVRYELQQMVLHAG